MDSQAHLRASDTDRDRAVALLRHHHDSGRLDLDDLEERLAAAHHAKTYSDLDVLFADLPTLAAPAGLLAPAGSPASANVVGGRKAFTHASTVGLDPQMAAPQVLDRLRGPMAGCGFGIELIVPSRLVFLRKTWPWWVWVVSIAAFPFGLVALLARQEERVTLEFAPTDDGRTHITAFGIAPRKGRQAVASALA